MLPHDLKLVRAGDLLKLPRGRELVSVKFRNDFLEEDEVFAPGQFDFLFYKGVRIVVLQTIEVLDNDHMYTYRIVKFEKPTLLKHSWFPLEQFEIVFE